MCAPETGVEVAVGRVGRKVCGNKCSTSCTLESQNSDDNARDMTSACERVGPASGAERCMIK